VYEGDGRVFSLHTVAFGQHVIVKEEVKSNGKSKVRYG
jgi:hypothetical protein